MNPPTDFGVEEPDPFDLAEELLHDLDAATDEIIALGVEGVTALEPWLDSPMRHRFVMTALVRAAGEPNEAVRAAAIAVLERAAVRGAEMGDELIANNLAKARERSFLARAPRRVSHLRILVTGTGPFPVADLVAFAPPHLRFIREIDLFEGDWLDVVIIGSTGYSTSAIRTALLAPVTPRFLPFEGLLDELLTGADWWTDRIDLLDAALLTNAGLRYVKDLEWFPWPGTDASESAGGSDLADSFRDQTPLFQLGYRRPADTGPDERWAILEHAVTKLGLQEVAVTIALNIRLRKAQRGGGSDTIARLSRGRLTSPTSSGTTTTVAGRTSGGPMSSPAHEAGGGVMRLVGVSCRAGLLDTHSSA